jgi:GntR family transcriptional repressor for pyruvate dehydrogenase complex
VASSDTTRQPIARRNTYALVADRLVELISTRRLNPGDPLPTERELTQTYAVGRSSVREGLRILESQGLIRSVAGGAFVVAERPNPLNSSFRLLLELDGGVELKDLFELRRLLECEAAALAAERRAARHLRAMDTAVAEMEAGLDDADVFIDADLAFHLAIAEATRNPLIGHSMYAIRDVIRRALQSIFRVPDSPERAVDEHRRIRTAIAEGAGDLARTEMRAHLERVEADARRPKPRGRGSARG